MRANCLLRRSQYEPEDEHAEASVLVTAQTLHNLERLAAMDGSRNLGRVVDKLTRDKMVSMWWKGELTDDAGRRG